MNYNLSTQVISKRYKIKQFIQIIAPFFEGEKLKIIIIIITVLINIGTSVLTPYMITLAIDGPIAQKNISLLSQISLGLIGVFLISALAAYGQARIMGYLSQRVLFRLRQQVFQTLQSLPIEFFHQNKAGDLISRINNDTDKINQFLSEGVLRFISLFFSVIGIAIMMIVLNWYMAILVLGLTAMLLIITRIITPFIEKVNARGLSDQGNLASEVQEGLMNFKVLVAFQIQEYFMTHFQIISDAVYKSKSKTNILNEGISPIYTLFANISQIIILLIGIRLIISGQITVGLLIGFIAYAQKFFEPLRILGTIIGNLQGALAAWNRVQDILILENNLLILPSSDILDPNTQEIIQFKEVSFGYAQNMIIHNMSMTLEKGKTYALVGPTGGGKSTTAALMARLYDPQEGVIEFKNQDIRQLTDEERTNKIGFILQEPFLFSGTLADNIRYGNNKLLESSEEEILLTLQKYELMELLYSFEQGLGTLIQTNSISLGQKQLISFIRVLLRNPELLILDEASANIDTVTEQKLQYILSQLPSTTTKVIIAHRLNTIQKADQIFFISGGVLTPAENFEAALNLIQTQKI